MYYTITHNDIHLYYITTHTIIHHDILFFILGEPPFFIFLAVAVLANAEQALLSADASVVPGRGLMGSALICIADKLSLLLQRPN